MKKKITVSDFISKYGILCVFVLMFIVFSIFAPNFLALNNIFNVARQIASLGICCVGMTMILICAGIDLSMGYQISVINVVCATLMVKAGWGPVPASLIGVLIGTLAGLLNGVIIVKTGVAPMIVTLAIMNVYEGISYMISKGLPIFGFPKGFAIIGQGTVFNGVPISLLIMIVVFIIGGFILRRTFYGRYLYAIGSNEEAAKLSGINVSLMKIIAYTICGFLTSIAAIIMLSRVNSGVSANGAGFEFNVITACVLGGVSTTGGKGSVFGALLGALIVGFLENGLLLMDVNEFTQLVIKGLLLLVAVVYDTAMIKKAQEVKKIKAINANN